MKRPEIIIISHVHDHVSFVEKGKNANKYIVQFSGVSDKPSMLMRLQIWDMSFDSAQEAVTTMKKYSDMLKTQKSFIFIVKD
jgi:hypothetical protein